MLLLTSSCSSFNWWLRGVTKAQGMPLLPWPQERHQPFLQSQTWAEMSSPPETSCVPQTFCTCQWQRTCPVLYGDHCSPILKHHQQMCSVPFLCNCCVSAHWVFLLTSKYITEWWEIQKLCEKKTPLTENRKARAQTCLYLRTTESSLISWQSFFFLCMRTFNVLYLNLFPCSLSPTIPTYSD